MVAGRAGQRARTLSGGERRLVALGRGLMRPARLMLIDEPSLGLAPMIVRSIFEIIRTINKTDGVSVLLVEQSLSLALSAARRAYVLHDGRIVLSGAASDLAADPRVVKAYLGT